MIDTKDKILDAAERAFAEYGYAAASLRGIIADAGVNLAAVHYHFGPKEELLRAVILRRVEPVNGERLALLEEAERAADPPVLEDVLRAFLVPTVRLARQPGGAVFVRMMGRLYVDDILPQLLRREFGPLMERFAAALRRALPGLTERELYARVLMAVGAMAFALRGAPHDPIFAEAGADADRVVAFVSAGLRAPVPAMAGQEN